MSTLPLPPPSPTSTTSSAASPSMALLENTHPTSDVVGGSDHGVANDFNVQSSPNNSNPNPPLETNPASSTTGVPSRSTSMTLNLLDLPKPTLETKLSNTDRSLLSVPTSAHSNTAALPIGPSSPMASTRSTSSTHSLPLPVPPSQTLLRGASLISTTTSSPSPSIAPDPPVVPPPMEIGSPTAFATSDRDREPSPREDVIQGNEEVAMSAPLHTLVSLAGKKI